MSFYVSKSHTQTHLGKGWFIQNMGKPAGKVAWSGVHIDNKLTVSHHISNLCKKANNKLSALIRLCRFYSFNQRRVLMKSFIESQFAYSPLVWMFHDRGLNNKINRVHERTLRCVYEDEISTFESLLQMDGSLSIHHRNIHALCIEMFKVNKNIGTEIMSNIFKKKSDLGIRQTRSKNEFFLPQVNTVHYGHDSLRYFGSKIWNIVPQDLKACSSVKVFKEKIKKWVPHQCPCRLCKDYIYGVGYIN